MVERAPQLCTSEKVTAGSIALRYQVGYSRVCILHNSYSPFDCRSISQTRHDHAVKGVSLQAAQAVVIANFESASKD
jgi:hypothetical protein